MREVVAVGRAHGVAIPEDFAAQRLAFADTLHPGHDGVDCITIWSKANRSSCNGSLAASSTSAPRWGGDAAASRPCRDALILHAAGRT